MLLGHFTLLHRLHSDVELPSCNYRSRCHPVNPEEEVTVVTRNDTDFTKRLLID